MWCTATPAWTSRTTTPTRGCAINENPFMGPFAKDYFSNFGKSTDFNRQLTRDYFFTVNHHWLEVYHVDGFRYDCVPNYWDGPLGVGYASLVYETYQLAKTQARTGRCRVAPVRRGTGSAARAGADGRAARGSAGRAAHELLEQHLAEQQLRRGARRRARRPRTALRPRPEPRPVRLSGRRRRRTAT